MLIQDDIPSFIQGISQQTPALRLSTQLQEQLNAVPDPVDGLRKRGSLRYLNTLFHETGGQYATHFINRDRSEQYLLVASYGNLRVFDRFTGAEQTVIFPYGKSYLECVNPAKQIKFTSIADFTFISNESVKVSMSGNMSSVDDKKALINVRQGAYNARYTIYINGTKVADHVSDQTDVSKIQTDYIAEQIVTEMKTFAFISNNYTVTSFGPTIFIEKTSGGSSDFNISSFSSVNESALTVVTSKTQRFANLPTRAPDGYIVEIMGDLGNTKDGYYVKFVATNPDLDLSEGYWEETVKQGLDNEFDPNTMPHVLVREANGSFTFRKAEWTPRRVGDDKSNVEPSFVGQTISNVLFYQNRLGFLSGTNIILSRSADYFNFWVGTAQAVLDDDPVDIGAALSNVTKLYHSVAFNEQLLLFSDQAQLSLRGGETLTPANVSLTVLSQYESNPDVAPTSAGDSVFFTTGRGQWVAVQELLVDEAVAQNAKADPVTEHVPRYIPKGVRALTTSDSEKTLVMTFEYKTDRVIVYNWYWAGRKREQSAWHEFRFREANVVAAHFFESKLYVIAEKRGSTHLFSMELAPGHMEDGQSFETYLDYKMTEQDCMVDDSVPGQTTIIFPMNLRNPVVYGRGVNYGVLYFKADEDIATNTVIIDKEITSFYVGEEFTYSFTLSELFYRRGEDQKAIRNGHLRLNTMELRYYNTGKFDVTSKVTGYDPFFRMANVSGLPFVGSNVGTVSATTGIMNLASGNFRFVVNSHSDRTMITISDTSILPVNILSATWFGRYIDRQRG